MSTPYKKYVLIFFCFASSIFLVVILFGYSNNLNHRNNNFTRLFPPHFLSNAKQLELPYNSFYLAGFTKTNIFLGNRVAAAYLFKTDYKLTDTGHLILDVPSEIKIVGTAINVYVDSPDIYMLEGVTPKILHCTLNKLKMADCGYFGTPFNAFSIISNQSVALRTFDQSREENMLAKSTIFNNTIKRFPGILTKRGDGAFSVDGLLIRDHYSRNLAYVYFYRNEFICLDTSLNILLKGNTIDSIQNPEIKVSKIISSGTTTFSSPPLMVNKTSCVDSNYLFVNSSLRAKNEDEEEFKDISVVDIYSLNKGEYLYSFYIPEHHQGKIKSFQVFNHHLIVLYDHSLLTFSMHF